MSINPGHMIVKLLISILMPTAVGKVRNACTELGLYETDLGLHETEDDERHWQDKRIGSASGIKL